MRTAGTRILGDTLSDIRPTRKTRGRAQAFEIMFCVCQVDFISASVSNSSKD